MTSSELIIVIGRQFGSGGREIGQKLAERLGVPYYDKRLLAEAARAFGLQSDVLARSDERRPSMFRAFLGSSYGNTSDFGSWGTMSPDQLYRVQSRIIEHICQAGPCVIVGRTADYIARHNPRMASIFVHAPAAFKATRIIARGEAQTQEEAIRIARKRDKDRQDYYNYYTGRQWGDAANYHFSLDSSLFSAEESAETIAGFMARFAARINPAEHSCRQ